MRQRLTTVLQENIDWDNVLKLGRNHSLLPLLYWHLRKENAETVPIAVIKELKAAFNDIAKRNILLVGELRRIAATLSDNDIHVLPYRGVVLAQDAYKNVALRMFGDIDLLIDKRDLRKIGSLLAVVGYEPQEELNKAERMISMVRHYHYAFKRVGHGAVVELHWAVWRKGPSLTPSQMGLWNRAKVAALFNTEILSASPEDMLLLLCMHGASHVWQKLIWICDIAEFIRAHPEIDWKRVLRITRAFGIERMLFLGLLLVDNVLDGPVPSDILRAAKNDSAVTRLAFEIERQLFHQSRFQRIESAGVRPLTLADLPFISRTKGRLRDRARSLFVFAMVPTLADYRTIPLPYPLIGIYLVLRPLLLLKRAVQSPCLLRSSTSI